MECGNQFCRAIRTKNSLTFENWFRKKRLKQLYKIIRWFDKFHLNVVKIANRTANKIISQSKWFLSQKIDVEIVNFDLRFLIKSKTFNYPVSLNPKILNLRILNLCIVSRKNDPFKGCTWIRQPRHNCAKLRSA